MLRATLPRIEQISASDRRCMLRLMQATYAEVDPESFEHDLEAKDRAVLLWNGAELRGFSTLTFLDLSIDGLRVSVVFSGDTVVHEKNRNTMALPKAWCELMAERLSTEPGVPLYWLLTSKGYKTYRYLPIFFRDYFPRPDRKLTVCEEKIILTTVAELGITKIDTQQWLIPAARRSQKLHPGVAEISEDRRRNPEIAFFEKANPNHARGDELICLVRFSNENMFPKLWERMMGPTRCP